MQDLIETTKSCVAPTFPVCDGEQLGPALSRAVTGESSLSHEKCSFESIGMLGWLRRAEQLAP